MSWSGSPACKVSLRISKRNQVVKTMKSLIGLSSPIRLFNTGFDRMYWPGIDRKWISKFDLSPISNTIAWRNIVIPSAAFAWDNVQTHEQCLAGDFLLWSRDLLNRYWRHNTFNDNGFENTTINKLCQWWFCCDNSWWTLIVPSLCLGDVDQTACSNILSLCHQMRKWENTVPVYRSMRIVFQQVMKLQQRQCFKADNISSLTHPVRDWH